MAQEQIKTSHIDALKEADERSRNLERAKAESDRSLKAEINRLSRQLAIRESSNTPMSAITRSLSEVGSTNRRGVENNNSSDRLESNRTTPQRGRHDQRTPQGRLISNVIGRPPWSIASLMKLSILRRAGSQGML